MASIMDRLRAMFGPTVVQISLGSDAPTQVLNYTASKLYQTQDNLQAVVNFLSNSIAQLPLKVYTRDGENDRRRDRDSVAAQLLWLPNRDQTAYEFIRALAVEYYVFGCVYVWVAVDADSSSGYQMRIIPSEWVQEAVGGTRYAPDAIRVSTKNGMCVEIPREEFVCFKTYSPGNPGGYISPISGLRQTLQEQIEAGNFRKQLWHSSGRLNAQITRPKDVAPWDENARRTFAEAFREAWGAGGDKAGSIPIMEDGMEIKPFNTSFKESQWAESVKLSRESVAAAYMINPSLVWHSDTQTYASSKDNARALYAECLGPVIQMIQQRINAFLLPMVGAADRTYVEFDLREKLKGSFEERASILQSAVGGPWMTRNEARADNNLPPLEGGDDLIVPLNVTEGGQASPTDTHMDEQEPMTTEPAPLKMRKKADVSRTRVSATQKEEESIAKALSKFFKRQGDSVIPRIGADSDDWWNGKRWDKELADDLEPLIQKVADAHGTSMAKLIGSEYDTEQTRNYLRKVAEGRAAAINESTRRKLQEVIDEAAEDEEEDEEHTPAHVFDVRENAQSEALGHYLALAVVGWAAMHEAPEQAKQQGINKKIEKIWVTGDNPRSSHALMNGETVPVGEAFSNGAFWPGDDNLEPDESCYCNCTTEVIITEE